MERKRADACRAGVKDTAIIMQQMCFRVEDHLPAFV